MKHLTLGLAVSLALAAGCDRRPTTPPSPKTDSSSAKGQGANPVQGEIDPKAGAQHRDFQQRGDAAGPQTPR